MAPFFGGRRIGALAKTRFLLPPAVPLSDEEIVNAAALDETLTAANDCMNNAFAALPIFGHYNLDGVVHSSSDGQKFETALPTFNARHSPKYFGLHKGLVALTLSANHVPINARIIGAHEHESQFVFDLLVNNTTEIQPEVHSTDTHGTNQVNFALRHLFGYQFAPRYRDIQEEALTQTPLVSLADEE